MKCPYCIDGTDFEGYLQKATSCLKDVDGQMRLKRNHQYFYQVQQLLFTVNMQFCDFVVCAFGDNGAEIVSKRIYPDKQHWTNVLPKLSHFCRYCILPEVLGRWYTRKNKLLKPTEETKPVSYCTTETGEEVVKCNNPSCTVSIFHPSFLNVQQIPSVWYCPSCQKNPEFKKRKVQNKDEVIGKALKEECICICNQKSHKNDNLLQCQNELCANYVLIMFFHLKCLNYKRRPNNSKTTWKCGKCKTDIDIQKNSDTVKVNEAEYIDDNNTDNLVDNFDIEHISVEEFLLSDEMDDIVLTDVTEGQTNKTAPLATLTDSHFKIILSPTGWLDCDIISIKFTFFLVPSTLP